VRRQPKGTVVRAVLSVLRNLIAVSMIIYLTFFFTKFFSAAPKAPPALTEADRVAAKKNAELQAQDRRLLTTYGVLNPAAQTVHIPIDRAMDLVVAENAPAATSAPAPSGKAEAAPVAPAAAPSANAEAAPSTAIVAPSTAAPAPAQSRETPPAQPTAVALNTPPPAASAVAAPAPAPAAVVHTTAPAPPPARPGLTPAQVYRAICITCHDVDGRGTIVRKATPAIPDFTDSKWQSSRTDAELVHSMMEGKGQFMLPMKDKFALARTDVKDMVAFVRGFQPGRAASVAANPPPAQPAASATQPSATGPAPTTVVAAAPSPAAPSPPVAPVPSSLAPSSAPVAATTPAPTAAPTSPPAASSSSSALAAAEPPSDLAASLLGMPSSTDTVKLPAPSRAHAGLSPEKSRAAGALYQLNCAACHGPDGKGNNLMRAAMPVLPDFTARAWQTGKNTAQFSASILNGKGNLMPTWRGKLTPDQAQDLALLVRMFGPEDLLIAEAPPNEFSKQFRELEKQWTDLEQQVRLLSGR
jgi:cytochrome c